MHFFVLQGTAKVVDNVQKNKLTPYSLAAVNAQIKVDIFCQKKRYRTHRKKREGREEQEKTKRNQKLSPDR
jgi:hypothetical protein